MEPQNNSQAPKDQLDPDAPKPVDIVKQPKKHNVFTTLYILGAIVIFLGFLMFHKPRRYQPETPQNTREVSTYLTHELAPDFNYNIQLDEPFNMLIAQQGLNDIISRGMWPLNYGYVEISAPAVVFTRDAILIMATVSFSSVPSVVTVSFHPKLDELGRLCLNLKYVKMGSVRITAFAKKLTRTIIAQQIESVEDGQWLETISNAILDNQPFEPVFPAYDKNIRLSKINIEPGSAVLTFEPEP